MRVAVFTDANLDSTSGVTTTLKALVTHAPPELQPRVYSFSDLEVDAPRYRTIRGGTLARLRKTRQELRRDEVEVVHMTTAGPSGLLARYIAGQLGLPLIGSLHEPVMTGSASLGSQYLRSHYLRWIYGQCRQMLLPSEDAARRLEACGWLLGPAVVWPRGVDVKAFSPEHRSNHRRDEWHVSGRRPAILLAGRLSAEKGAALLEPISSLLHRQRIAHRFIVMGAGPMRSTLQEHCPDALFTGPIAASEVPHVMASADVLLYPGQDSSGCSVLLEAQASGLPVVVASAGSARENMLPGRSGFVCRAADVEDFAVRLGLLLVDLERRRTMGEAARTYARTRSWERSFATVCAAYRDAGTASPLRRPAASLITIAHQRSAGPQ
jgi:glycosyltransferase involved in cell wall biosynthesis